MEKNIGKIFAWIIIIIILLLIIYAIYSGISQLKEHNRVIKDVESASTFDEVINVHTKYAKDYLGIDTIEKVLDERCYNYLNAHIKDLNGICMPYYISCQENNIKSNYKMVMIFIKDTDNVYILPKDIICKTDTDANGNEKIKLNEKFFDIVNNTFKIENLKNANEYRYKINGTSASDKVTLSSGKIYPENITYFLDSYQDTKKHLWLKVDKYNNIALSDLWGNGSLDSDKPTTNYYITTPNIFNLKDIAKQSKIEINFPSVLIKDNSVLYTYNIGVDESIANDFFHKYQEYLKSYYTITTNNDIVYVYANELVAAIKCGHDETGYFMMLSFNYNDKYYSSNNSKYNYNSSSSGTKKSGRCGYKYPDGSICGRTVGSHSPLCDYHFYELYSTYKYFTGN